MSWGRHRLGWIFRFEGEILPLEAKSGLSRKTKSLRIYAEKYGAKKLFRTSPRNLTHDGDLMNIPLYGASLFPEASQWPAREQRDAARR